jgi:lipopolysaccharide export system permease protein
MRILSRYLLKQHLVPFVFALSAITAFQLLNQIARRFGDLVGKGLPWHIIAEVFALSIPFIVSTTLSMAVLMAVLYAINRLTADHELTAIRAGGISLGRLMAPLLLAGAVVSVLSFFFSDLVLPRTNHRLRVLLTDISRKKPTFSLKEQVINEIQRNRTFLRASRINQSTFALRDVTLYDLSDQERKRIIYADSGSMALTANQEVLYLTLYDGTMHEMSRSDPQTFQEVEFQRNVIRVEGVGNVLDTSEDNYKGDREMSVCEMETIIHAARREAIIATRRAETARINGLRALVRLAPVPVDTTAPLEGPGLYCRALNRVSGLLLPAKLAAQQRRRPPVPTDTAVLNRFNEPARRAFTTGRVERPRLADVLALRDRGRSARIRAANYLVEVHKKYAIAVACVVFVLVGVPAAIQYAAGGIGFVIGTSLVVFTVYYVGLIGGEALANRLIISAFWAMWTPNLLFAVLGLLGLWRLRRATGATLLPQRLRRWLWGSP